MTTILVAGLINIETTLKIDGFPLEYAPVRYPFFGVNTTVSGVGYNITKALTTLGNRVNFLSLVGQDAAAELVRRALENIGVDDRHIISHVNSTAQSVILYDETGKRAIYTDLKDIQEHSYPHEPDFSGVVLAALCNINFTRPMLKQAQTAAVPIATDVHTIRDIDDDYNRDYMAAATLLFQSHEGLSVSPEAWIRQLWQHYGTPIAVIGLGAEGALLAVKDDNFIERIPAVYTRPIVSTIGGGDALFSSFVHVYAHTGDPYAAIRQAVIFASYKIGVAGAADGFLTADELALWNQRVT